MCWDTAGTWAPLTVSPNPVLNSAVVSFYQVKKDKINISLIDTKGREVKLIYNGHLNKGGHEFNFTTEDLHSGLYLLKVHDSAQVQIIMVIVRNR